VSASFRHPANSTSGQQQQRQWRQDQAMDERSDTSEEEDPTRLRVTFSDVFSLLAVGCCVSLCCLLLLLLLLVARLTST
jgi:hypothetical protein